LISRGLARTARPARIHSILHLVFSQIECAAFRLHLGPWNAAAHACRSNHELRLEIHAANGLHLHYCRRCLALPGPRLGRLAVVAGGDRNCLFRAFPSLGNEKEVCPAHISFRRMKSTAPASYSRASAPLAALLDSAGDAPSLQRLRVR